MQPPGTILALEAGGGLFSSKTSKEWNIQGPPKIFYETWSFELA